MAPLFNHYRLQANKRWLSPLLLPIMLASGFIVFDDVENPAAATDCLANDLTGTWRMQGGPTSVDFGERNLASIGTSQRDTYTKPLLFPVVGAASYMQTNSIILRDRLDPGTNAISGCLRQDMRTETLWNGALIKFGGKTKDRSLGSATTVSLPPHLGKTPLLSIRRTPPKIAIVARGKSVAFIGPVDQRIRQEADTTLALALESLPAHVGGQSLSLIPLHGMLQLPYTESLRMNLETALALRGGTCANGCP